MTYIRVKNWKKFQHYKDRCPPWIKLHVNILNDRQFVALDDASQSLLMLLWILASEDDGFIPYDKDDICFRLRKDEICINRLVKDGFLALASERSSETETETETDGQKRFIKPTEKQVKEYAKSIEYDIDPERFISHYESKGWMIGKSKMKSWKAAITTWKKNDKQEKGQSRWHSK